MSKEPNELDLNIQCMSIFLYYTLQKKIRKICLKTGVVTPIIFSDFFILKATTPPPPPLQKKRNQITVTKYDNIHHL